MAYLPVELALKLPVCIVSKIQLYLSSTTADLIKDVFDSPEVIYEQIKKYRNIMKDIKEASNRGLIDYVDVTYYKNKRKSKEFKNIQCRLLISKLPSHSKWKGMHTTEYRYRYPLPGFNIGTKLTASSYYCLPNIKWTQPELYMLCVGLLPVARKSWSKRKLLQELYCNLRFI